LTVVLKSIFMMKEEIVGEITKKFEDLVLKTNMNESTVN